MRGSKAKAARRGLYTMVEEKKADEMTPSELAAHLGVSSRWVRRNLRQYEVEDEPETV